MRRLGIFVVAFAVMPCLATPRKEVLDAWMQLNAATIEMTSPGASGSTKYEYEITPESDSRIQVSSTQHGQSMKGTVMLVSGVLLAKDVPGDLDLVDACGITLQLVNKLLAYGSDTVPLSIRGLREIAMTEKVDAIEVKTSGAEAKLDPPWKLSGTIDSQKVGHVTFDLTHTASVEAAPVRFVGTWEKRKTPPELPDSMSIAGWKVYRIGTKDGRYGATASEQTFATLGALRAALSSGASPR